MRPKRLLVVAGALLLSAACANDTSSSTTSAEGTTSVSTTAESTARASQPGDPDRYCRVTQRLEAAGKRAFGDVGRDASPADYEAAERAFVLDNAALLDELIGAAPATLTPHVDTMLTAMRQRGGLVDGRVKQQDAAAAETQLLAFEKKHC